MVRCIGCCQNAQSPEQLSMFNVALCPGSECKHNRELEAVFQLFCATSSLKPVGQLENAGPLSFKESLKDAT